MEQLTELRAAPGIAGVVEVRVRHADALQGPTLGWFPIDKLQHLIGVLRARQLQHADMRDASSVGNLAERDTKLHGIADRAFPLSLSVRAALSRSLDAIKREAVSRSEEVAGSAAVPVMCGWDHVHAVSIVTRGENVK